MMRSYDIFDTLITRKTAYPSGIFAIMQNELRCNEIYSDIDSHIRNSFFEARRNAEALARKHYCKNGIEDVTLEQIYLALGTIGTVDSEQLSRLMKLEQETEYDNVVPIWENIVELKNYLKNEERVILISDMYLSADFIRSLLCKFDKCFNSILIYVSSERKKKKATGNLYFEVWNQEQCDVSTWFHKGDNDYSDFICPQKIGIHCQLFQYEKLKNYEKEMLIHAEENVYLQKEIGDVRNIRLQKPCTGVKGIGCSLCAPILTAYMSWMLSTAVNEGIERLYFIARDGYVLKNIADILIFRERYGISTKYVYGSRRAWRMASFVDNTFDLSQLFEMSHMKYITTFREFAAIFELSENELKNFVDIEFRAKNKLSSEDILSMKTSLKNNSEFLKYLEEKNKLRRDRVLGYFNQELDLTNDKFAFVELAGSGYTQMCMANILADIYSGTIRTFYFKMDKIISDSPNCRFYNFFPSALHMHVVIETFARAPHGQTVDYCYRNKWLPVFDDDDGQKLIEHGFNDYIQGIRHYVENCNLNTVFTIGTIKKYMDYIIKNPDTEVLNFVGGMPNNVTGRSETLYEFAPVLTYADIINIFLLHYDEAEGKYYKGTYLEYSILRCSDKKKKLIDFCTQHKLGKYLRCGNKKSYIFPFKDLKGKVILYAAGNVGKAYYNQIKRKRKIELVLWVDKKYALDCGTQIEISNPLAIMGTDYDYIIVAVESENAADSIVNELVAMGVEQKKILWKPPA